MIMYLQESIFDVSSIFRKMYFCLLRANDVRPYTVGDLGKGGVYRKNIVILPKHALSILRTDRHEIGTIAAIVVILQAYIFPGGH